MNPNSPLIWHRYSQSLVTTRLTCSLCSSQISKKIKLLSRYTADELFHVLLKNICHHMWEKNKAIGESKWHNHILNVTISGAESCLPFIPGRIQTRLYAPRRSNFVKYFAPLRRSKRFGINGRAYLFRIVTLFSPR